MKKYFIIFLLFFLSLYLIIDFEIIKYKKKKYYLIIDADEAFNDGDELHGKKIIIFRSSSNYKIIILRFCGII
jgi:hypothetical protein